MTSGQANSGAPSEKLSPQFASRISNLGRREKIRAIILVKADGEAIHEPSGQIRTRSRGAVNAVNGAFSKALSEVDGILKRHSGQRISASPNALGSIVVETTPAGVLALADSEHVRAIFEDQRITQVR